MKPPKRRRCCNRSHSRHPIVISCAGSLFQCQVAASTKPAPGRTPSSTPASQEKQRDMPASGLGQSVAPVVACLPCPHPGLELPGQCLTVRTPKWRIEGGGVDKPSHHTPLTHE